MDTQEELIKLMEQQSRKPDLSVFFGLLSDLPDGLTMQREIRDVSVICGNGFLKFDELLIEQLKP